MTVIRAIGHVDRVVITHSTLALKELADDTLTILDITETLNEIIVVTGCGVLKTADTAVKT